MSVVAFTDEQLDRAYQFAQELGAAIRAERERTGLSQLDLSAAVGAGGTNISDLERGAHPNTSIGNALRVLNHLGLTLRVVPLSQENR